MSGSNLDGLLTLLTSALIFDLMQGIHLLTFDTLQYLHVLFVHHEP